MCGNPFVIRLIGGIYVSSVTIQIEQTNDGQLHTHPSILDSSMVCEVMGKLALYRDGCLLGAIGGVFI